MKPFGKIDRTAIILGIRSGKRRISVSFFFDREMAKFMQHQNRHANDIHMFGRFRFSNTVD